MKFRRSAPGLALTATLLAGFAIVAGVHVLAAEWPPLEEVASRIHAELSDAPAPDASVKDVQAYVRSLAPRVLPAEPESAAPALVRSSVYTNTASFAYLRVGSVRAGLRQALDAALTELARTNSLAGTVLDLRFAEGADFGAAVETAGLFASRKVAGFRLGDRSLEITPVEGRTPLPVMVLVNPRTRGAAEALAAAVRAAAAPSVVIGTNTAGRAREYRAIRLTDQAGLQIAGNPLLLPDGAALPTNGLAPDLLVSVNLDDERAYLTNEYLRVVDGRPAVTPVTARVNEAELVRRRQGRGTEDPFGPAPHGRGGRRPLRLRPETVAGPEPAPVVQDPVLARALDLLSGLATPPPPVPPGDGDSR